MHLFVQLDNMILVEFIGIDIKEKIILILLINYILLGEPLI